jgi:quercetin dioxygenase-like cupin family protein
MRHFLAITSAFLAMLVGGQAVAQQPPAQPITRTVVAATKLPTVTDRPLLFRALSVTIPPGEKSSVSAANGILYQMSGSTEASIGGEAKALSPGDGLFLAEGTPASLEGGNCRGIEIAALSACPG